MRDINSFTLTGYVNRVTAIKGGSIISLTNRRDYKKETGALVKKEFLYPGDHFPFIDGVIFSEASNLQQLLGCYSTSFSDLTNTPHFFPNYSGKKMADEVTRHFYSYEFEQASSMVSLTRRDPVNI